MQVINPTLTNCISKAPVKEQLAKYVHEKLIMLRSKTSPPTFQEEVIFDYQWLELSNPGILTPS